MCRQLLDLSLRAAGETLHHEVLEKLLLDAYRAIAKKGYTINLLGIASYAQEVHE